MFRGPNIDLLISKLILPITFCTLLELYTYLLSGVGCCFVVDKYKTARRACATRRVRYNFAIMQGIQRHEHSVAEIFILPQIKFKNYACQHYVSHVSLSTNQHNQPSNKEAKEYSYILSLSNNVLISFQSKFYNYFPNITNVT